jgi:hypothetical protein
MDWDSLLKLFHLEPKVEIDAKENQVGIINIRKGNSDSIPGIHVHLPPDPETARAFVRELRNPEIEEKAREATRRKLEPLETVINTLLPSTQDELAAKTMGLSAIGEIHIRGHVTPEKFGVTEFVAGEIKKKEE